MSRYMLGLIASVTLSLMACSAPNAPTATLAPRPTLVPTIQSSPVSSATSATLSSSSSTARTPTTTASSSSSGIGTILFQDDFSNPNSGWNTPKVDYGQFEYKDGAYRIFLDKADFNTYSLLPNRNFDNVSIEVDVTLASGPTDAVFGVFCRADAPKSDLNKAYEFFIRGDGVYAILKRTSGNFHDAVVYGNESGAVNKGNAANHLRADCAGANLALWVNGKRLLTTTDNDFKSGQTGMGVSTQPSHGKADVRFDNFLVRAAAP